MSPIAPYDDFKEVIDREGHGAGDKLLSPTVSVLNAATSRH